MRADVCYKIDDDSVYTSVYEKYHHVLTRVTSLSQSYQDSFRMVVDQNL